MFTRRITELLLLLAMLSQAALVFSAPARNFSRAADDPISGEWDLVFSVDATKMHALLSLKLEEDKLTGTLRSDHTGPGVLRDGVWANNKLSFTAQFENHESIALSGELKNGTLEGEFRTEGFVAAWEATRKVAAPPSPSVKPKPGDPITGEWDATFAVGEQKFPFLLKLNLEGTKIEGTVESPNAGSGAITEGSLTDAKVAFTMPGPHGSIKITGALKEGKLAGDFSMGQIKGTWTATRK